MKEQFGEISQKDIMQSGEKKAPGLELVKGPELDELANVANNLACKIEGNKDVFERDLDRLREALGKLKVNFFGEEVTIEQIKKNPDFRNDFEIIKEIKKGELLRTSFLRHLTSGMAKILVDVDYHLQLDGITAISNEVAEILGMARFWIRLPGLRIITAQQLRSLCYKTKYVELEGLELKEMTSDTVETFMELQHRRKVIVSVEKLKEMAKVFPGFTWAEFN